MKIKILLGSGIVTSMILLWAVYLFWHEPKARAQRIQSVNKVARTFLH